MNLFSNSAKVFKHKTQNSFEKNVSENSTPKTDTAKHLQFQYKYTLILTATFEAYF